MLGKDSVLAQIGRRTLGSDPESPAQMGLVENTTAAIAAQFSRTPLKGRWLKVDVWQRSIMAHPLTGSLVQPPPTALLTQRSRPLAVLIGDVLVISRTAPRCVRTPLIREARSRHLDFEEVDESRLWRLVPKAGEEPAAA